MHLSYIFEAKIIPLVHSFSTDAAADKARILESLKENEEPCSPAIFL